MRDLAAEVLSKASIIEVASQYTNVTPTGGDEHQGLCPLHNEKTPSFTVNAAKKLFHCFGCGESGNVIQLVERREQIGFYEACKQLAAKYGIDVGGKSAPPKTIEATYDYRDSNGELVFQVVRYKPKTFRQRRPDPKREGEWIASVKGIKPLPYRLPDILAKPNSTVLIVEGEKDADNLAKIGLVATTNPGGAGKWRDSLNPYFKDRKVVIIPDSDAQARHGRTKEPLFHPDGRPRYAGMDHALEVAAHLSTVAASVRVVDLDLEEKRDVSDWIEAGGTAESLKNICRNTPIWHNVEAEYVPDEGVIDEGHLPATDISGAFRCLGYDEGAFYYFPFKTQQIVHVLTGSHASPANLVSLAPLELWEAAFPAKSGKADWIAAANACMRWNESIGPFNPNRVRGRGAWHDEGRAVMHFGDRLLVNDVETPIHEIKTQFIYERKPPLEAMRLGSPLPAEQGKQFHRLVDMLNWQRPVDSMLFTGACFLATVCGALQWRPHVWLTGARGTGKTWILENIVQPLLGDLPVSVLSTTTEAGIRQTLKLDARPVVFDESDAETVQGRARIQQVIELARQASSESSGHIVKGTTTGKAMSFHIRSTFLLSSINVGLVRASDASRFTVLALKIPPVGSEGNSHFKALAESAASIFVATENFGERFRARAYQQIPTLRRNARVLATAVTPHIGNQRGGDQIGTLLAGFHGCVNDGAIEKDTAQALAGMYDWKAEHDEVSPDEVQLLHRIMSAQIIAEAYDTRARVSVIELVETVTGTSPTEGINAFDANRLLERHGIKADSTSVTISNSHDQIRLMLRSSAWEKGWSRLLERLKGAERRTCVRFAGLQHRAVKVPLGSING